MITRSCMVAVFLLLGISAAARTSITPTGKQTELRDTSLTVGQGWAMVREIHAVSLKAGIETILLDTIPPEADLASLIIRTRRIPVRLLEWGREGIIRDRSLLHGLHRDTGENTVTWIPDRWPRKGFERQPPPLGVIFSKLKTSISGEHRLLVSYMVTGLYWKAQYNMAIRNEPRSATDYVSIDLNGTVTILNGTSRRFNDVRINLVGKARPGVVKRTKDPGFLMVADTSPLSDLWKNPVPEKSPEYIYPILQRASLAPHAQSEVTLIDVSRLPARPVYSLFHEDIPLDAAGELPLTRYVILRNLAERGLGKNLPPGPLRVYQGGRRRNYQRTGFFPRSLPGNIIRTNLGPDPDVLGKRRSLGRSDVIAGNYEERFEIIVRNKKTTPIKVEIREKPPTSLKWEIIKSNEPYDVSDRRIHFTSELAAFDDLQLIFELRVGQPSL